MSDQPAAMVVLASEQLWPSIQGLVYWQEHQGGLTDLCIYHTSDKERSVAPAQRLQWLCNRLYPRIQVRLSGGIDAGHDGGNGDPLIQPAAVRAQLRAWRRELADRRLVINATGGTKLMFAGVLDCLQFPHTEVVYRELQEEAWYRLTRDSTGVQTTPLAVQRDVTDAIPVEMLLQCHWEPPQGEWHATKPRALPIERLTAEAERRSWDWKAAFYACGLEHEIQVGFLFEQYVAASLLALGIKQVALNCCLQSGSQMLLEVDVVANHGSRLLIIDCKLRRSNDTRVEGITSQMRQAAEIRRRLGGLACELLLLRPGMRLSKVEQDLAKAHGLHVLDSTQTLEYFNRLWGFVRGSGPLPAEAARAQAVLDAAKKQGALEALAGSVHVPGVPHPEPMKTILNFDSTLTNALTRWDQDWVVYRLHGSYFLYARTNTSNVAAIKRTIRSLFGNSVEIKRVNVSQTGNTFWVCLVMGEAALQHFKTILAQIAGKRVFS